MNFFLKKVNGNDGFPYPSHFQTTRIELKKNILFIKDLENYCRKKC
jgi:hypothetical protein